ncbi:MAG: hypothetical protein M9958_03155 [Chitinophagales bacterium]|nr:hypothetical protein [Chitinophagales bacterium]
MNKVFDINIERLTVLLLPIQWRQVKMMAWLKALTRPIHSLYGRFITERSDDIYTLEHNSQVCYLRAALNDRFDNEQRRIEIIDGYRFGRWYIYSRGLNKPQYLGVKYIRQRTDYEDTRVDFIVLVPIELMFKNIEIKALVDIYRLASKRYTIEPKD